MVRFLYRADYREAARYLDAHPEVADIGISSALLGPWDRLALEVDTRRDDVAVRLFDPERALVWVGGEVSSSVLLTGFPCPSPEIEGLLEADGGSLEVASSYLELYTPSPITNLQSPISNLRSPIPNLQFANGLELVGFRWASEDVLLTSWLVATPLDLPPVPIVANPPPPGVYSGPRLAVFTHLLDGSGAFVVGDDGLWVDPLTLRPGDRFLQIHRFALPSNAREVPFTIELGLYDPMTGERWSVIDAEGRPVAERVLLPVVE